MTGGIKEIDAEKSEAFNPDDRDKIFDAIRKGKGFATVNQTIRQGILGVYLCGVTRGVVKGTHTVSHMQQLIKAGGRVDQVATQLTSLGMAASADHHEAAAVLLLAGATVDQPMMGGNTALHLAARDGAVHVVRLLLEHEASRTARNHKGQTPAEAAESVLAVLEGGSGDTPGAGNGPADPGGQSEAGLAAGDQAEWVEFEKDLPACARRISPSSSPLPTHQRHFDTRSTPCA